MPLIAYLNEHILYVLLAFAAAVTFAWLLLLRERLRIKWYTALILSAVHVVYGVLCVRFFALVEAGFNTATAGNMSLFGAVFFMPVAYSIGAKLFHRRFDLVFDIFAICMIFTLMCARVNCLFEGCCLGRMISSTGHRWPTRELEIVFYLLFLGSMAPRVWKDRTHGEVYPLYMAAYGAFRFVVECFRVSDGNNVFHVSHIWAGLALAVGLGILLEMKQRRTKNEPRRKTKKR